VERVSEASGRERSAVESLCGELSGSGSVEELLSRARITYHAPADATRTGMERNSVDVVFLNSVLEHVKADVIVSMMEESERILRPGGLAIHSVNCGDHYAYGDKKVTAINYLQYSEAAWRFWNNDLMYQNRLRPCDIVGMAEKAGLEVILRKQRPRESLMAMLEELELAPEFRKYPREELCSTSVDFVARKA